MRPYRASGRNLMISDPTTRGRDGRGRSPSLRGAIRAEKRGARRDGRREIARVLANARPYGLVELGGLEDAEYVHLRGRKRYVLKRPFFRTGETVLHIPSGVLIPYQTTYNGIELRQEELISNKDLIRWGPIKTQTRAHALDNPGVYTEENL